MYRPINCTQEQLIPTRWIVRAEPTRLHIADHVKALKARFGRDTARECMRRLYWVGIVPSNRNRWESAD